MRLILIEGDSSEHTPLKLSLEDFIGDEDERPAYAILSHRWREEEVLFTDFGSDRMIYHSKKGYAKLETCCRIALFQGLRYVWSDTCCIDKTSSGI